MLILQVDARQRERKDTFAGSRPRQQCRSSSSRPEEKNATRGDIPGNEAEKVLRKAIGESDPGKGRCGASCPQARSQAGDTRWIDRRATKEGDCWQGGCAAVAHRFTRWGRLVLSHHVPEQARSRRQVAARFRHEDRAQHENFLSVNRAAASCGFFGFLRAFCKSVLEKTTSNCHTFQCQTSFDSNSGHRCRVNEIREAAFGCDSGNLAVTDNPVARDVFPLRITGPPKSAASFCHARKDFH